MASNPKRRGQKRRAKKQVRKNSRPKAKTVRTKTTSVRVMRTNTRRKRRRTRSRPIVQKGVRATRRNARRPRPGVGRKRTSSSRFTIAFAPAAAKLFARVARLSKPRRREMLRSLRRHGSGGVYVAQPSWHGTREQAARLAERVRMILVYAAGRRRASLGSASAPRVIAVP